VAIVRRENRVSTDAATGANASAWAERKPAAFYGIAHWIERWSCDQTSRTPDDLNATVEDVSWQS
jgi:hypothetical protein